MITYTDRVTEIANLVAGLAGAGVVHNRTRLVSDWAKYVQFFRDAGTGRINGWEISRTTGTPEPPHWEEIYILRKVYGMKDADATDLDFQESLDDVVRLFRDDPGLTFGSVPVGVRIPVNEPRVFGGVLCHYAECRLPVNLYYDQL